MNHNGSQAYARLLAIDVCGTLYRANTTAGLIEFHHARNGNRIRSALAKMANSQTLPFTYAFTILSRIVGFDFHRFLFIASLRGEERSEIERSAKDYVGKLESLKIEDAHRMIANLRASGWSAILVSNSISPIVCAIGEHMNVPWVSSDLGWNEETCTGMIARDLTGRKRTALEEHIGGSLTALEFKVITDNRTDKDLVDCSEEPIVVLPRGRKNWTGRNSARIIRT